MGSRSNSGELASGDTVTLVESSGAVLASSIYGNSRTEGVYSDSGIQSASSGDSLFLVGMDSGGSNTVQYAPVATGSIARMEPSSYICEYDVLVLTTPTGTVTGCAKDAFANGITTASTVEPAIYNSQSSSDPVAALQAYLLSWAYPVQVSFEVDPTVKAYSYGVTTPSGTLSIFNGEALNVSATACTNQPDCGINEKFISWASNGAACGTNGEACFTCPSCAGTSVTIRGAETIIATLAVLVDFVESGLPTGTNWSVVFTGGIPHSSIGNTIVVPLVPLEADAPYSIPAIYSCTVHGMPGCSYASTSGGFIDLGALNPGVTLQAGITFTLVAGVQQQVSFTLSPGQFPRGDIYGERLQRQPSDRNGHRNSDHNPSPRLQHHSVNHKHGGYPTSLRHAQHGSDPINHRAALHADHQ